MPERNAVMQLLSMRSKANSCRTCQRKNKAWLPEMPMCRMA